MEIAVTLPPKKTLRCGFHDEEWMRRETLPCLGGGHEGEAAPGSFPPRAGNQTRKSPLISPNDLFASTKTEPQGGISSGVRWEEGHPRPFLLGNDLPRRHPGPRSQTRMGAAKGEEGPCVSPSLRRSSDEVSPPCFHMDFLVFTLPTAQGQPPVQYHHAAILQ